MGREPGRRARRIAERAAHVTGQVLLVDGGMRASRPASEPLVSEIAWRRPEPADAVSSLPH